MKKVGDYWVPDHETLQVEALSKGVWQGDHLEAALRHVKRFGMAVDGGAHVGSWSLEMAKRFRTVMAFEPAADTYACLVKNTEDVDNILTFDVALGRHQAKGSMHEDGKYHGGNTGGRFVQEGEGEITIMPLDAFRSQRVDFLKLDVEGHELFALAGAAKVITRDKPVIMIEDKIRMAHRFGLKPHAARDYLVGLGMTLLESVGNDHVFGWPE